MLKNLLLKKMLKSQLKDVPQEQQEKLRKKHIRQGWKFMPSDHPGSLQIIQYSPHRVELSAECLIDTILASSENFSDDWRVSLDGKSIDIESWLGTFRSLPLKKGKHRIVFYYDTSVFDLCLKISLLALGLLVVLAYLLYKQPKT